MEQEAILEEAELVVSSYKQKHKTFALIESCTGGLAASTVASVSGASEVLKYAVVSYTNTAKIHILGIDPELLETYGAVSAMAAKAMAKPKIDLKCDVIASVTGVAGPQEQEGKAVGLVYIGINNTDSTEEVSAYKFNLTGSRNEIRIKATQKILELL